MDPPTIRKMFRVNSVQGDHSGWSVLVQGCWNPTCSEVGVQTMGCYPHSEVTDLIRTIHPKKTEPSVELKLCGRCWQAAYCSRACQVAHHEQHQHSCVVSTPAPPQLIKPNRHALSDAAGKLAIGFDLVFNLQCAADVVLWRCMAFIRAVGGPQCCVCNKANISNETDVVGVRCLWYSFQGDCGGSTHYYLLFACTSKCYPQLRDFSTGEVECFPTFGRVVLFYQSGRDEGRSLTARVRVGDCCYYDSILESV